MTFKGYDEKIATFGIYSELEVGDPIALDIGYAIKAENNAPFIGICKTVRGRYCGIQLGGYVEAEYTGSVPSMGYQKLVAATDQKVKIKADANVNYVRVIKVDEENKIVGFIL